MAAEVEHREGDEGVGVAKPKAVRSTTVRWSFHEPFDPTAADPRDPVLEHDDGLAHFTKWNGSA